ncbi:MAG TPA: hypothetical protein PLP33_24640 [Leptospiraceae bacterium]|nr:hypothetical protein [Leptospiraceae bacterium]
MADIKLAEKSIPEGFSTAKMTVLGYSYSDGLYVMTSGEKRAQ